MRSVRKDSRSGLKERYKCAGREKHRPYVYPGPRSLIVPDRSRFRIITSLIFRHIHQNLDRDKRSKKRLPERGLFLMSKRRNAVGKVHAHYCPTVLQISLKMKSGLQRRMV